MQVNIVTYNRLVYLRRCIDSIIATSSATISVVDDGSTDGSQEYLYDLQHRGLIDSLTVCSRKGTAHNFNHLLYYADPVSIMCNDDMYFYRDWDTEIMKIYNKYDDCGLVSFYDYTRYNLDEGNQTLEDALKVTRTGLGCTLIDKGLFDAVGGFYLPEGKKMGFLATPFCKKANASDYPRNKHYATLRNYAHHMDLPNSRMCERDNLTDYCNERKTLK